MNKISNKLKIFILSLILAIPLILMQSSYVFAEDDGYNGDKGSDTGYGKGTIGASQDNTAFMMYLAYKDTGTAATPGILVYNNKGMEEGYKEKNFLTKTADGITMALAGDAMGFYDHNAPSPIKSRNNNWVMNGLEVRKYLMDQGASGKYRFEVIIENRLQYFDDTCREAWENTISKNMGDFCVIVQPVAKLHLNTSYDRIATTDGWVQWINSGYSHSFVTGAMYNCMVLETERFGLSVPADTSSIHSSSYDELSKTGWGIHIIDIPSTSIRTYWEPNGSPGDPEPAEPNKTGRCAIVKGYYEENETTGVKTGLGVYTEQDVTNNIIICNEPEFELVQWDISSTFNSNLDPTNWNPPSTIRSDKTRLF